jgi:hypothetical protein
MAWPSMWQVCARSASLRRANRFAEAHHDRRPQVVHEWRRHADFPEPVASLKTALIWSWAEIEDWAKKTGRLA